MDVAPARKALAKAASNRMVTLSGRGALRPRLKPALQGLDHRRVAWKWGRLQGLAKEPARAGMPKLRRPSRWILPWAGQCGGWARPAGPQDRAGCGGQGTPVSFPLFRAAFSHFAAFSKSFVMKTFSAKGETVQRDWYIVDAEGKTLGRLCTELARRLRGKHKPVYTPHVDTGDYLVVVNAEKIHVTGNKLQDKKYHRFTGYIGNLKTETLAQALDRHPERVIEIAVKGMLPKNPLGRAMYRKLKVYKGADHPHAAQQPQTLDI